jgi:hypothetical protein
MHKVDLRQDAKKIESSLTAFLDKIRKQPPKRLSAIAIGFDCDQAGWVMFVGDNREEHQRDGECFDEDCIVAMPHWNVVDIAGDQAKQIVVTKMDGTTFEIAPFDEEDEEESDYSYTEADPPFCIAIGEMILSVVMNAKKNGRFQELSQFGAVQIDIEDFNGGWAWPEYDQLGKSNLA